MRRWRVYVEGSTDSPVIGRVAEVAGLELGQIIPLDGAPNLDAQLPNLLRAATRLNPILVLRDVDPTPQNLRGVRYARCASAVLKQLGVPNSGPGFCFRLARHEMEAWLLADHDGFSKWLGISRTLLPKKPDELLKPSHEIVQLARHPRANPRISRELVPLAGSKTPFGTGFESAVTGFARGPWQPRRAARLSPSLRKCLRALKALAAA